MAHFFSEASRTFSEYLLLPNLTTKDCIPENVILRTPLVKFIVDPENKFTFSDIYVIVYDYGIFNRFTQTRP